MNNLLLILTFMVSQISPEFPFPDFVMECYPKTVMPGDTLYVTIVAKNPFEESIFINDDHSLNEFRFHLRDSQNQQPLCSDKKLTSPNQIPPPIFSSLLNFEEIRPGNPHLFFTSTIQVPPLEDLKEPFWEKYFKNLATGNEEFMLNLTFKGYFAEKQDGSGNSQPIPITLEIPITIKQRSEKEMALIRKWHNTLADYLVSQEFQKFGVTGPKSDMPKNTIVKNEKFSHWYFVQNFNLYPNTLDIPETWQGWKALEDSLSPSTMRDEIRLTRILIQYCDTQDEKVLDELKTWFDVMNEVQRTVMAKSIRDRAEHTYGEKLLPQFCEIYKTIREYDVVPIPESKEKHLRDLGILE